MPGFKDYLASDLDTFINQGEFADFHDIDGRQVKCVVDSDILQPLKQADYDIAYNATKMLFVKASDLPERPVKGQRIRLDGELFTVALCGEAGGMLEITLEAIEA
ncbi:head-tail joining protein [Pelotomaculum propionicicum]|uniref:Uncharacterized protein n=1 Tax=Pelotomaculum propionicicum TaxID=258475 RepID=A0A4Y7RWI4_9FIRM|nr:hypothetical protein [Pelotomaculum propionicicum]TEB13368.1 hypothetical protein Pmgp_00262 [Pelotomaculum propionicicum]